MSETTNHGDNIAGDIQDYDAYGQFNVLTTADVWNIIDNIQTHLIDKDPKSPLIGIISEWMRQLEKVDEDLPL